MHDVQSKNNLERKDEYGDVQTLIEWQEDEKVAGETWLKVLERLVQKKSIRNTQTTTKINLTDCHDITICQDSQ